MAITRTAGNYIKIKMGTEFIDMPDPDYGSCVTTIATNVKEGRNSQGNFVGSVVGSDKVKIEPTWSVLTGDEMATLLSRFDRRVGGKFVNTFRILDPRDNSWHDFKMYCSDRSGRPMSVTNAGATYWLDVKISLVQV